MWNKGANVVCLYLLSVGVAQHIASHYVDEVGFRVDFTHEATKPPPESEQKTNSYTWSDFFSSKYNESD